MNKAKETRATREKLGGIYFKISDGERKLIKQKMALAGVRIARRLNSGGGYYPDEIDEIHDELTATNELFGRILEQLSKIK